MSFPHTTFLSPPVINIPSTLGHYASWAPSPSASSPYPIEKYAKLRDSEHRQRKENYVKHLERDIINLREMIATATTQTVLFKHENEAMRTALSKSHIPISLSSAAAPLLQPVINLPDAQGLSYSGSEYQQGSAALGAGGLGLSPEHEQLWNMLSAPNDGSSHSGSLVSIGFDEILDASCLQISTMSTPAFDFGNADVTMAEADPFNLGTGSVGDGTAFDPFNANPSPNHLEGDDVLPKELPAISVNAERVVATTETDLETVAVNFILAYVLSVSCFFFSS